MRSNYYLLHIPTTVEPVYQCMFLRKLKSYSTYKRSSHEKIRKYVVCSKNFQRYISNLFGMFLYLTCYFIYLSYLFTKSLKYQTMLDSKINRLVRTTIHKSWSVNTNKKANHCNVDRNKCNHYFFKFFCLETQAFFFNFCNLFKVDHYNLWKVTKKCIYTIKNSLYKRLI